MFKKVYLKVIFVIWFVLLFTGCSSMPDVYDFQRPDSVEECYETIVDIKDNYDTHMFLLREEKLDGVDVKGVFGPARLLLIAWDNSVELLGNYVSNKTPLNEKKLFDSIDNLKQKNRMFLTASNKILGMDIVQ